MPFSDLLRYSQSILWYIVECTGAASLCFWSVFEEYLDWSFKTTTRVIANSWTTDVIADKLNYSRGSWQFN